MKRIKVKKVIISLDIKEGCGIDYGVCYPTDNHIEIPYYEKSTLKVIY